MGTLRSLWGPQNPYSPPGGLQYWGGDPDDTVGALRPPRGLEDPQGGLILPWAILAFSHGAPHRRSPQTPHRGPKTPAIGTLTPPPPPHRDPDPPISPSPQIW